MNLIFTLRTEIACLLALLLLLWYSSIHGTYENIKKYKALNVLALVHVLFDMITMFTVNNRDIVPPLANRFFHEMLYLSAVLFCYMLLDIVIEMVYMTERSRRIARLAGGVLPVVYVIVMSFLPIEYVEGNGTNYTTGPCLFAAYGCAAVLILISFAIIIAHKNRLSMHDRNLLQPSFVIMLIAILIQVKVPEFLFTGADVTLVTAAVFIGVIDPVGKFRHKAYFDHMTGLRNHNCYDDDMEKIRKEQGHDLTKRNLMYVACDINGLKQINDEQGHAAGDEYIIHAARSLRESLTGAKAIYRIGGDEFCAIYMDMATEQVRAEIAKLRKVFGTSKADAGIKEVTGRPFSLSIGYVKANRGEDILDTAKRADTIMMNEKRKYYETSGVDRRRRSTDTQ